jgi:hypothetical protein
MYIHWRKTTNEREGKPKQKYDAAFGTIFRINKYFQRSKDKLCIHFPFEQSKLKIYNPFVHDQKEPI